MSSNYKEISDYNEEQLGKDRASRMSQVAMYSETAHFVYELLQNADDAEATEISFSVSQTSLVVEHNGKPFTEDNVKAISYFGKGKTDITKIGHFGLGFKSVFAYTASPYVHSGDESFEITDLYSLDSVQYPGNLELGKTRFIFPFDHELKKPNYIEKGKLKTPEIAYSEIAEKLSKLSAEALLFTKSLTEIRWETEQHKGHYLREIKPVRTQGKDIVKEMYIVPSDGADYCYLIVERPIEWPGDDGIKKEHRPVQIAFRLDKRLEDSGSIMKVENARLFVFFPTVIETHVGFILQGPYRTTPQRETVPADDEFNQYVVKQSASLLSDSLSYLRDLGLLNVASYSALPLRAKDFPEGSLFLPIYDKVHETLKTQRLLPAHDGSFIYASEAKLACDEKLVELFSPEQLGSLLGKERLVWLDATITERGETADLHTYLVGRKKNQGAKEWEQEPLIENIEVEAKNVATKLTADFFQDQDEQWLIKFYAYLGKNFTAFQGAPFVRLENGQHVLPGTVEKSTTYLPPANASTIDQTIFPFVKQSLASNPEASKFLRQIAHLREPDKIDVVIRCLLPKFCTEIVTFEQDGYVHDLKEIATAYSSVKPNDAARLVDKLKETKFVAAAPASNPQGEVVWVKPGDSSLYRQSLELEQWFAGNATDIAWFSISVVGENLPDDLKSKLGFALGALIKRSSSGWDSKLGRYRRPEGGFDAYADIVGVKWAIDHPSNERAIYLWNRLLENVNLIRGKEIRSTNQQFPANKTEEFNDYSIMGNHCKGYWLPKQNTEGFFRPADLFLSELPEDFEKGTPRAESVAHALMKKPEVEHALDLVTNGDDDLKKLIVAYQSGSNADREKLRKMIPQELSPQPAPSFKDGLANMTRQQRGTQSGDDENILRSYPVSKPDHRQNNLNQAVADGVQEHATTQKIIRFSPVRDQPSNKESRQTLYQEYQGRCQVTGETFLKASANANGEAANYFEVCSLLPYGNADYLNDAGNMLCVSADTMAKLNHASFEWLDDIEDKITEFDNGGKTAQEIKIRIHLAGEECDITWSQRHFMRLVALYQKA